MTTDHDKTGERAIAREITPARSESARNNAQSKNMKIVGMGGSAGALEAFEQFFLHLPADTGMAFVLVPHLEPTHKGVMPEILRRHTPMNVAEAEDGMEVLANHVYVIPPNRDIALLHGKLQVLEPTVPRGLRTPINYFFEQLAADQKEKAIAIILSGMGTDGTLGLKAIKENFGMVMVQDPSTAKFDGMPRSAVNTGLVDYIARAEELPGKLLAYANHKPQPVDVLAPAELEPSIAMQKVFVLLRSRSGNDFSTYKHNTVSRRIERRMNVHQFDSLPRYVRYLQENPQEVDFLYKELLIGVTNFFRDAGLFDCLARKLIPQLLENRPRGKPLRVWIPACSTGEETYSLAIVLKECLDELPMQDRPAIQIFATDIDAHSVEKARQGAFLASIASDVSPERLQRFFARDGEGYRVKNEIREMVIFAPQNILVDPPFTKVDILCCRNLLIYLNVETQKKVLSLMHYALNPGGMLILGTAESAANFGNWFASLDNKWKVFQRLEAGEQASFQMPAYLPRRERVAVAEIERSIEPVMDIFFAAQRALLDLYGPSAVVVSAEGDIIYVSGRTGKYLEPPSGKANINVFAMAREGLREELGTALRKAAQQKTTVTSCGVRVKTNGDWTTINLTVRPVFDPADTRGMFVIVFEEAGSAESTAGPPANSPSSPTDRDQASTPESNDELRRTRERLQSSIEEMQAAQEELRSANEELQSTNEELQSTNEELTSSKEELQSLNEEMQTVNSELQTKIEELSQSNSDMKNLLNGTEIATIFLDNELRIKRFTSQAPQIVHLIGSDVGRPISHLATNLNYDRLVVDARQVLDSLVPLEAQVQTGDGRWYNMRVLPYRTSANVIDGVVMTFIETTVLKHTEAQLQSSRDFAENIIATIREPLLILDGDLRIVSASRAFYRLFAVAPAETEGRLLYEIAGRQWDIPSLRGLLEDILPKNKHFDDFRVEHVFSNVGPKVLLLNARRIEPKGENKNLILLAMEDISERRQGDSATKLGAEAKP